MRLLVTGGAGFIGSHFCKLASQSGHEVVVYDNLSTGHRRFAKFGTFVEGDIRDTAKLTDTLSLRKIQAVVHFAAKALVGESMQDPGLYYSNNTFGTISLLAAMKSAKVSKLVFSSSCATYGISQSASMAEDHQQKPVNPYGRTKLQCEEMILDYHRLQGFQVAMLRYFNVIGQDPDGELWEDHTPETHVIPNLWLSMMEGRAFSVFGKNYPTPDGTCVRDYVDVNDLGRVHLAALTELERKPLLISNVGMGRGYSVLEVAQAFETVFQKKLKLEEKGPRAGDPPTLVADARFFRSWYQLPLKSLEQSLESLKYRPAKGY